MQCVKCEDGILVGRFLLPVEAPVNRKGGGISMAGITLTQAMAKAAWEAASFEDRNIACASCGALFSYQPGKGFSAKETAVPSKALVAAPMRKTVSAPVRKLVVAAPARQMVSAPKRVARA